MRRITKRRLLVAVALLGLAVAVPFLWRRNLSPEEQAVVGAWITAPQSEGVSTELVLGSDGHCRVRWLDASGAEAAGMPPWTGRWELNGETLKVDTRPLGGGSIATFVYNRGFYRRGNVWFFAAKDAEIIYSPQSDVVVPMHRTGDHRP